MKVLDRDEQRVGLRETAHQIEKHLERRCPQLVGQDVRSLADTEYDRERRQAAGDDLLGDASLHEDGAQLLFFEGRARASNQQSSKGVRNRVKRAVLENVGAMNRNQPSA